MEVRRGTSKDIPALVPLWTAFMDYHADLDPAFTRRPDGDAHWVKYIREKMQEDDFRVFVADEDGDLVGYTVAFINEYPPIWMVSEGGFIDEAFVDPAYRRRGVGRRLFAAVEEWVRSRGLSHVELKVDVANEPTRKFWREMGLEPRVEIMGKWFRPHE